jgi:GNAT superfamily N-acetyltransferase
MLHRVMITESFLETWQHDVASRFGLRSFQVDVRDGDLRLTFIGVPRGEEGQGRGTAALRALCGLADEFGYRIVLTAPTEALIAFYERFGFTRNVGPDRDRYLRCRMRRDPC